ncbi:hypothetical protein C2S52_016282 [Perilla frutescens var. hirtella]|nr:hypothetical protein C2S52_016282 [Perilla frutescens var. hirtella]
MVMEKVVIEHFCHEHPLILKEIVVINEEKLDCYGCENGISNMEKAYVCVQEEKGCNSRFILHKRCGEFVRKIRHPSHSEHPLHLVDFRWLRNHRCNLCRREFDQELGYRCDRCDFDLDITCEKLGAEELLGEARELQHPSHIHPLMLIRKPPFVFDCDACDTRDEDMAYVCTACDLMIHRSCALLPSLLPTNRHRHHHHLSLSSRFPFHHRDFVYRYFAHFKCATSSEQDSGSSSNVNQEKNDDDDGSILIQFPLEASDISEELIRPFVIRQIGQDPAASSCIMDMTETATHKNHKFTLCTSSKNDESNSYTLIDCSFCFHYTNGMVYECEECEMKIDVKCASLPTSIKHAYHPHHSRLIKTIVPEEERSKLKCYGCGRYFYYYAKIAYRCTNDGCDFMLCPGCVLLPRSVTKHEWEKHPLLLTYDASIDHPSDFYCDFCERQMHPKSWMYHCRPCDNSYHLSCLETASGNYRNIKFGRQVELDARLHPHPLTFNYVTLKRHCDICHRYVYTYGGFECASCNYAVCLSCGEKHS